MRFHHMKMKIQRKHVPALLIITAVMLGIVALITLATMLDVKAGVLVGVVLVAALLTGARIYELYLDLHVSDDENNKE